MDLHIERADSADAEEILALQKLAYRSEAEIYQDEQLPPLTETVEEVRAALATHLVLKVVLDGIIIGAVRARVEGDTCCIGRLIVHPRLQNRGIGAQLLEAVESCFPDTPRFELFTGHLSARNLHLYHKLGYREFKTEPVHAGLSLVYLEKRK